MQPLLLPGLLFAAAAHAQDEAAEAELVRLREELLRLAGRQAWSGVEDVYARMEALGAVGVPLEAVDLDLGAYAARARGDLLLARARWEAAQELEPSEARAADLADLAARFGEVSLGWSERYEGTRELVLAELPFAPDERAALARAQETLAARGAYVGLLPAGRYSFGERRFRLKAGDEDIVQWLGDEASAVPAAETSAAPLSAPRFTLADAPAGLVVSIGPSLARFGRAGEDGVEPAAFGGPGGRVSVGWMWEAGGPASWLVDLSWRGLFRPTADPTLPTASSHLVSVGIGPELYAGRARFGGGLGFGVARTVAVGMDAERHEAACAAEADPTLCPSARATDAEARSVLRGTGAAGTFTLRGGVQVGALGPSALDLGLVTGLDFDVARASPWLGFAVGLSPARAP